MVKPANKFANSSVDHWDSRQSASDRYLLGWKFGAAARPVGSKSAPLGYDWRRQFVHRRPESPSPKRFKCKEFKCKECNYQLTNLSIMIQQQNRSCNSGTLTVVRILCAMPNDFGRNTAHDVAIGHIFGDHCTGSNHHVVTNCYARVDNRTAANPNVVADRDRLAQFLTRSAQVRVDRVGGRQNADPRAN